MTRLLRAASIAAALSLLSATSATAASRDVINRDRAATYLIASDTSLAAQATLQQKHITVKEYRIFERTDPSASLLYITGPTKHHRALFVFRQNVKVCINLPVPGGKLILVKVPAKFC